MNTPSNLHECVRSSLQTYFNDLNGTDPADLYNMLIQAVERPLLELVMEHSQHNQSRAAQWLGLNRNTLRKKLLEHKLID